MTNRRPCRYCGRWFTPDKRVGERQISCAKAQCRQERKTEAQSKWLARNPEYFHERRLRKRSEAARAAEEAARNPRKFRSSDPEKGPVPRRPAAVRMAPPLDQVPWDLAQDEIGVQVTDFIGLVAKVLLAAVQDEFARQVTGTTGDPRRVPSAARQDEIAHPPR